MINSNSIFCIWPYSHRKENVGAKMHDVEAFDPYNNGFRIREKLLEDKDTSISKFVKDMEMPEDSVLDLLYGRLALNKTHIPKLSKALPKVDISYWKDLLELEDL